MQIDRSILGGTHAGRRYLSMALSTYADPVVMAVTNASAVTSGASTEAHEPVRSDGRWIRVGHSWDPNPTVAGDEATRRATEGSDPRLVLVFASARLDLGAVAAGVARSCGDVPVLGCGSVGEIGPGPVLSPGVVVVCFGGGFAVSTSCAVGLRDHPRDAGERVASGLLPLPDTRYRFGLMLTDALAGDQQEMIRGAYGVLGAGVPIVGGGSAGAPGMTGPHQIYCGRTYQDAVVAAVVGSDGPFGLAMRHGWRRCGTAMVVTDSDANEVFTLDDRPALDCYLERHPVSPAVAADPTALARFVMTRPLALGRRGEIAMRQVLRVDHERRSLVFGTGVPKGAAMWFAEADQEATLAATELACAEAVGQLPDERLLAMLVFNSAGRRALLGDDGVLTEAGAMRRLAGGAPLAGCYTHGELARLRGIHAYHNQTIVALALS